MKDSIEVRIGRYLANEMSGQEKTDFQNELASNTELKEAYLVYLSIWNTKPNVPAGEWNTANAWEKFEKENMTAPVLSGTRRIVLSLSIAATVLVLLGVFYFYFLSPSSTTYQYSESNPVIELKDGSQIHMNKGSVVTVHPFTRKSRHVELSGEAFFEVSPDASRPFTIACGNTITEVVGTSFNIRQIMEAVELYVNSGKVIFRSASDSATAVALKAGEGAYYENEKMKLIPNPSPNSNAWHTHQLQFKSMPLIDAVHDVSTYFGQEVMVENADIHNCKISIPLPYKNPEIKAVLTAISRTVNATFVQEGNKCIIRGGTCQ